MIDGDSTVRGRPGFVALARGAGDELWARGSRIMLKATAASTGGSLSLMERELPPGGRRPPPHRHGDALEAFYVLDGVVLFELGDERRTAAAGDFVLVQPGTSHSFSNPSGVPARLLVLHTPAKDAYFRELAELLASDPPPDLEDELALMRRHGMDVDRPG